MMLEYCMENKIKIRLRLVIIKEDKLLAYYDSMDDYYFYIGGKLEFGETIEAGWKREIKEELAMWLPAKLPMAMNIF